MKRRLNLYFWQPCHDVWLHNGNFEKSWTWERRVQLLFDELMVNKLDSLVPKVLRSKTDDNYSSSVEFPSKAFLDILTNNNQSIFLHTASFITKCHMLSYLANCHWSSAVDETNSLHPNISAYILLTVLDTFLKALTRRLYWRSFILFSEPICVIQG